MPAYKPRLYRVEMVSHTTGQVTLILKTGLEFGVASALRDKHANDGHSYARMVLDDADPGAF